MTRFAIVGTGFVADYYMTTLANYPDLEVACVYDRDPARLSAFAAFHKVKAAAGLDEALAESGVAIVINLTTPESHYEINCAAIAAGKHIYCEKPLGMSHDEAADVVARAKAAGLTVCGAPANALSPACGLVASLIENGRIGKPRLAYAEMEDGPVFRDNWRDWRSRSGAKWPGVHEFEIGCTLEHAGYGVSWLAALFGPVSAMQAFSALTFPEKGPGTESLTLGPDFSVGCLTFASGVTARITCGLAAPRDRSLTVIGDEGLIVVRDLWDDRSPVHLSRFDERKPFFQRLAGLVERTRGQTLPLRLTLGAPVAYPEAEKRKALPAYPSRIDFARGIHALAASLDGGPEPFFSGDRALHLTELVLALNGGAGVYKPRSSF